MDPLPASVDPSAGAGVLAEAALFYGYLGHALRQPEHLRFAWKLLDRAIGHTATTPMVPSLYGGFCNVGWTVQHLLRLRRTAPRGVRRRFLEEIDEAAHAALDGSPARLGYDLLHGLVGLGVYFLERLPQPRAVLGLERAVEKLRDASFEDRRGIGWRSTPEHLPGWLRTEAPQGIYDFGMAHGNPGVIALLAALLRVGIAAQRCREMLASAVPWLLAQRQASNVGARFPSRKHRLDDPPQRSRLAWCYGDPGPGVAVFSAGTIASRRAWQREGLRLLQDCAARDAARSGVLDATVCHGAAGLAHLYNRMAQAAGDAGLRAAARAWLDRTLEMRVIGSYVGGYAACCTTTTSDQIVWRPDLGLLTGASGIGLVLLACVTPTMPAWDRRLLLS